ncbi:MAG TPA: M28 family metallopeptidase [Steroidobacteraceae bacterium]|nr:M28 family metallopeptidase [Steroidobacteraceae bacterium]
MHAPARWAPLFAALFLVAQADARGLSTRAAVRVGERCWSDVRVLADDAMEGRRAGTPGHRRAAEFVAAEFRKANLEPGGEHGFFQPVRLESRQIVEANSSLALLDGDARRPLEPGKDAIIVLRGDFARRIEAPMIFVGDGLRLPQYGVDDLAGLDLRGKVVVFFATAPPRVPGAAAAHFGSTAERWKVYRAAGAVGMVAIPNPANLDLPWERLARSRLEPYMALLDGEDPYAGLQLYLQFNPAGVDKLLAGTGHTADEILALMDGVAPLPHFELPARIAASIDARVSVATSENVVARLPGSDPALRAEHVVLSAHLDHLGVATAGTGDRIYNGAMDNAAGIAVLLQMAREMARHRAPRRSIVFAAVTAEEVGLLGSRAFVSAARARGQHLVANLNTDMFLPLHPMRRLLVFGLEESELGDDVRAVALAAGLDVQSDPEPLRNRFIRSDQYSFIRAGIPALATKVGFEVGSAEAQIQQRWYAERYHAVTDAPDQPVDLAAVGHYEDVIRRLALRIANRDDAPRWRATSVFAPLAKQNPPR